MCVLLNRCNWLISNWLKREQERAVKKYVSKSRPACCVADCVDERSITNVCPSQTLTYFDCFFFCKTPSTMDIAPVCCYEKDLQFSREI